MDKFPKGIDVHSGALRIRFTYRRIRCSESLKGLALTKPNIAYAKRKLDIIKLEIKEDRFNYKDHFPQSRKAELFSTSRNAQRTIEEGVRSWLKVKEATLAPSGYRTYLNKAECHILTKWGRYRFTDVTRSDLMSWITVDLIKKGLSNKTINCILTPLRGAFEDAHADGVITSNPFSTIKNLELDAEGEPDPLTLDELETLVSVKTYRVQEINAIGFNAWSGLREAELLALAWEDIDVCRWVIRITRNRVNNEYKVPKTKGSVREFDLLPEAIEFLKRQMEHTYMLDTVPIKVRQRNNRAFIKEDIRFVFHSSVAHKPWSGDGPFRKVWAGLLRQAKIRHRGPNQLRHTFISQMLTQYVPPEWLAPMCGTSVTMIRKHYGKFIREDRPNLGAAIAKIREKSAEMVPNWSRDTEQSR